jgi:hypothetical protein
MIHESNRSGRAFAAGLLILGARMAAAGSPPLLSLTMEHFRDTATVTEGPAAGSVAISTEPGFIDRRGPLRTVWNDEYLRAVFDSSGDRKSFEVDVTLTYSGARRSYPRAEYHTPSGDGEAGTSLVKVETANCAIECMYTEHLVFPIEERTLREIAAGYAPGKAALWSFRLLAKTGPSYRGEISNAEVAGLLARVDGYHPPIIGQEAPAPRPRRFGLAGNAAAGRRAGDRRDAGLTRPENRNHRRRYHLGVRRSPDQHARRSASGDGRARGEPAGAD